MRFTTALMLCAASIANFHTAAAEDLVRDSRFNGGHFNTDTFGGISPGYQRGQRIAMLPDGDLVVAAVVPRPDGAAYTVGLVRYGVDGVPHAWAVPSHPYTAGTPYVIFERPKFNPYEVKYVRDLKYWNGVLYVLVSVDSAPVIPPTAPAPFEAADEVYVLTFEVSGKFLKENKIRAASKDPTAPRSFAAGGIALYIPDLTASPAELHLVYTGSAYTGRAHAEFARYSVDGDGGLTEVVPPTTIKPRALCKDPHDCEFRAIALGGRTSPYQPPRIYLGGWRKA